MDCWSYTIKHIAPFIFKDTCVISIQYTLDREPCRNIVTMGCSLRPLSSAQLALYHRAVGNLTSLLAMNLTAAVTIYSAKLSSAV